MCTERQAPNEFESEPEKEVRQGSIETVKGEDYLQCLCDNLYTGGKRSEKKVMHIPSFKFFRRTPHECRYDKCVLTKNL